MKLSLPPSGFGHEDGLHLYEEVSNWLRDAIRRGELPHGTKLPSSRELSEYTTLNRSTISAAYAHLEKQGLLHTKVGSGTFINISRYNRQGLWAKIATEDGPNAKHPGTISFAFSRPSSDLFPIDAFQDCAGEVVASPALQDILQLGSPQGFAPLRNHLLEVGKAAGTLSDDDDVLVTNGCQQAMDLLHRYAQLELAKDGRVSIGIEDPVYPGVRNAFTGPYTTLFPIPVTKEGASPADVSRLIVEKEVRLIAVTPDFQNPTGWTMSPANRKALAKIVAESGTVLVESAIYSGLRYGGASIPSIRRYQSGGSIVQIGSFSKLAFPGLRVGWVFGPKKIIRRLTEIRHWCDLHTDQLSQAILLQFSLSGRLSEHQQQANIHGRQRLTAVLEGCAKHLPPGSQFSRPLGGMNLWVELPAPLNSEDLLAHAKGKGVSYLPGPVFGTGDNHTNALRLSFAGLSPMDIEHGLERLGAVAKQRLQELQSASQLSTETALV